MLSNIKDVAIVNQKITYQTQDIKYMLSKAYHMPIANPEYCLTLKILTIIYPIYIKHNYYEATV